MTCHLHLLKAWVIYEGGKLSKILIYKEILILLNIYYKLKEIFSLEFTNKKSNSKHLINGSFVELTSP